MIVTPHSDQIRAFLYDGIGYSKLQAYMRGKKPTDQRWSEFFKGTLMQHPGYMVKDRRRPKRLDHTRPSKIWAIQPGTVDELIDNIHNGYTAGPVREGLISRVDPNLSLSAALFNGTFLNSGTRRDAATEVEEVIRRHFPESKIMYPDPEEKQYRKGRYLGAADVDFMISFSVGGAYRALEFRAAIDPEDARSINSTVSQYYGMWARILQERQKDLRKKQTDKEEKN